MNCRDCPVINDAIAYLRKMAELHRTRMFVWGWRTIAEHLDKAADELERRQGDAKV